MFVHEYSSGQSSSDLRRKRLEIGKTDKILQICQCSPTASNSENFLGFQYQQDTTLVATCTYMFPQFIYGFRLQSRTATQIRGLSEKFVDTLSTTEQEQ